MKVFKSVLPLLLIIISIILFLGSCFITATDGQGGIVFIFSLPIMIFLLAFARLQTKKNNQKFVTTFIHSFFIFLALFFGSLFLGRFSVIPSIVIGGVSKVFEHFSGKTPYKWARDRNDMMKAITEKMNKNALELNLSEIKLVYNWDKVCFFGPYSDEKFVNKTIGFEWPLKLYSKISESDSINLILFIEDNRSVSYAINFPRGQAEFVELSGKCFKTLEARFKGISQEQGAIKYVPFN